MMARTTKLKVYRTVAGFYDAYVAAPSQKAALAAWGSDRDLFARGIAEQVTDPELTAEPLASPGTVIRHSRGTTVEQIAAMPAAAPTRGRRAVSKPAAHQSAAHRPDAAAKRDAPKPSSAKLDAVEQDLAAVEARYDAMSRTLDEREAALARERRDLDRDRRNCVTKARESVDHARKAYDAAIRRWKAERRDPVSKTMRE